MKNQLLIWITIFLSQSQTVFSQNKQLVVEQVNFIDIFEFDTFKIFKFKRIDGSVFYESNFNDTISIDNYNLAQQIVHERFFFNGMLDSVFYSLDLLTLAIQFDAIGQVDEQASLTRAFGI